LLEDDTISLVGIVLYGYHGARPEERTLGQRFIVDVDLHADLRVASRSDDLANTVNYSEVYQVVETIIGGEPVNLIETLAARIAEALLSSGAKSAAAKRAAKLAPLPTPTPRIPSGRNI